MACSPFFATYNFNELFGLAVSLGESMGRDVNRLVLSQDDPAGRCWSSAGIFQGGMIIRHLVQNAFLFCINIDKKNMPALIQYTFKLSQILMRCANSVIAAKPGANPEKYHGQENKRCPGISSCEACVFCNAQGNDCQGKAGDST